MTNVKGYWLMKKKKAPQRKSTAHSERFVFDNVRGCTVQHITDSGEDVQVHFLIVRGYYVYSNYYADSNIQR